MRSTAHRGSLSLKRPVDQTCSMLMSSLHVRTLHGAQSGGTEDHRRRPSSSRTYSGFGCLSCGLIQGPKLMLSGQTEGQDEFSRSWEIESPEREYGSSEDVRFHTATGIRLTGTMRAPTPGCLTNSRRIRITHREHVQG